MFKSMKKSEYKHSGSMFKSIVLMLKCIFAATGYGLLWLGIIFLPGDRWIAVTVCGAVITFLSLILFIINPLNNSKRK